MNKAFLAALLLATATPAYAATVRENLCGWIENPTPANWWLTDRWGEWIISTQGGHQAEGDLPEFSARAWVATQPNGHGYGCGCLDAVVNTTNKEIVQIHSARVLSLSACRRDPALREPKAE